MGYCNYVYVSIHIQTHIGGEDLMFQRLNHKFQLEIYSRCYKKQPLVIQGAGAGNDTTAAGVLADILDIQDLFP
ncbi:hypothetical protein NC653_011988 [Populus alba x Populus x berolinensis]|uniref:Homoserine dehydrogenase catalytic domain-containing protein n=1 Tax=Populus alba x Populus x berolinensis TaxID=444605 RepID=A0AAD6R4X2_9ROSI|nr:hypothetical protein NC653_011988 [Populus alba x Populus x berolinensis]